MIKKKHFLAGILASAMLVFGLSTFDITKATPENSVDTQTTITEEVNESEGQQDNSTVNGISQFFRIKKHNKSSSHNF